ncbi:MAG: adenylyltransferase/cytidyltransferase family protein [Nanoarchaeota archaeon]
MKVVIASGYFDPLHVGHVEYLQLAKKQGDILIVILNNDYQCILKKGKPFMPAEERKIILEALRCVDEVFDSIDNEKFIDEKGRKHIPVTNSIRVIAEKYSGCEIVFAKGGDRFSYEIPEAEVCRDYNIKIIDSLGKKIQSSSDLTGLKEVA